MYVCMYVLCMCSCLCSIISSRFVTGFNNFYRYSEQKSAGLELNDSEDYLLVAEYKENGGQDYIQVRIKGTDFPSP